MWCTSIAKTAPALLSSGTPTKHTARTLGNILNMKLQTTCKKCNSEISFYTWNTDRVSLAMKKGKVIKLDCKNCDAIEKYHLNELTAKPSKIALLIGLIIFVFGTPFVLLLTWDIIFQSLNIYFISGLIAIIGAPLFVYLFIERNEANKVRNFNNFKINE